LLLPAGFIKLDHEIRLLRLKIRWWIVERKVAILTDSHKGNIHWLGTQFPADFLHHYLRVALTIQKMVLRDSRLMD
jgi:hypothetical protein